jgi:hypothetical protein
MNEENPAGIPRSHAPGAGLRIAGLIVLIIGLGIACARLWSNHPASDAGTDLSDDTKKAVRDQERNFGKMGVLSSDLSNRLEDPVTQAAIIAGVAIVGSAACFYIGHLKDRVGD